MPMERIYRDPSSSLPLIDFMPEWNKLVILLTVLRTNSSPLIFTIQKEHEYFC